MSIKLGVLQPAGLTLVVLWAATHFLSIVGGVNGVSGGGSGGGSRGVRNLCVSAERNKVTFEYELDHKTGHRPTTIARTYKF